MPVVRLRPAGERDIEELALYIAQSNPPAASHFLESVSWTCELLAEMPRIGVSYPAPGPRLYGLRQYPVRDYPNHLLFYLPAPDGIEIVRVLHGARDLPAQLAGSNQVARAP